jgi:putative effector of murein hydrolase
VSGLVSSALGSRVLRVSGVAAQASILTRAITTPLALAASKITGADPTLTSAISLFTGIIGASIGTKVLRMQGVEDDVSVGIATGAAAHSLGAASVVSNPVRFASAIVAMCLTGVWTVVLLSIPQTRVALLRLAAQPALPLL